jgi:GT2 family glycosyltransferase
MKRRMSESHELISVIIPSYQPDRKLADCLDSILSTSSGRRFEVWVVDSTPDDITGSIRGCLDDSRVHLLRSPRRLLPGEARDMGVGQAKGDILVFIDADCIASGGWLDGLVDGLLRSGAGVCGGSVENGTPDSYFGTADYLSEFGEYTPRNPSRSVRFVPSCSMALSREVWSRAGGFPAGIATGEDVALGKRIIDLGMEIRFIPQAVIYHQNQTGAGDFCTKQYRLARGSAKNFVAGNQPYSRLGDNRLSACLFLAAVFPGRLWRVISRTWRNREIEPLRLLAISPALVLGAACFAAGFIASYRAATSSAISR